MSRSWHRVDNEILSVLQDVVAIESINPDLPGGKDGELRMVEYIAGFFADIGLPCETHKILPARHNIIATLDGEDPDRVLLFECHMDTVSVDIMTIPPFTPDIRDGLLYGRGACDTKAGGVAMMMAMKRLKEKGVIPSCTIKYAGVVDEEHLFRGASHLASIIEAEAVVVSEPTELEIVRTHKGLARFRIIVKGTAAHSSKPHLGINAITKMARLICAIEDKIVPIYNTNTHPLVGSPTLNIGVISGGVQINFVPDQCAIEIDRRTIPGERPIETLALFQQVLSRAQDSDPDLDVTLEEPFLLDEAMETSVDSRIVQIGVEACQTILGEGVTSGVPYGTDASKFTAVGIPAIVLGPGSIDQAHAAVEWVECHQVLQAVDIYQQIMMNF
ncbi:TPA: M20 family peptidase [Candidatus Poribacteria bacterium]|nr:M20 family peptidase [Candidatus Poribacteria bacterium]HIB90798.1 M20 family peptidase [Candidatus Poribacteria bacterium]HIN30102.1 M20 family peptidase [Candidatus Poribacteria bacterium]HIO08797.1 M20 family peptidase [Candidatus Poribacteria bacterium]HIO46559.1 M20 family peptidase [Candidatus Poribacteria bacterium]